MRIIFEAIYRLTANILTTTKIQTIITFLIILMLTIVAMMTRCQVSQVKLSSRWVS